MEFVIVGVLGVIGIVAVSALSPKLGVAAPLVLVVLGTVVSLWPGVPLIEIEPEWILAGVLPPLLYSASVSMPTMDFRRDLKTISLLSVVLVVVTSVVIGFVFYLIIPEVNLATGIALGAVVSPTDAVATSIVRRVGAPARIVTVLEGESMFNDASALVLLRSAIAASAATISIGSVVGDFFFAVVVAAVIGVVVGYANLWIRTRIRQATLNTAISFVIPFIAFVPAEELGASGLVAVVVTGLITGSLGPRYLRPQDRIAEASNWSTVELLLEGAVFVLMGLELKSLVKELLDEGGSLWNAVLLGVLAAALLAVVRAGFLTPMLLLMRRGRRRSEQARPMLEQAQTAIAARKDAAVLRVRQFEELSVEDRERWVAKAREYRDWWQRLPREQQKSLTRRGREYQRKFSREGMAIGVFDRPPAALESPTSSGAAVAKSLVASGPTAAAAMAAAAGDGQVVLAGQTLPAPPSLDGLTWPEGPGRPVGRRSRSGHGPGRGGAERQRRGEQHEGGDQRHQARGKNAPEQPCPPPPQRQIPGLKERRALRRVAQGGRVRRNVRRLEWAWRRAVSRVIGRTLPSPSPVKSVEKRMADEERRLGRRIADIDYVTSASFGWREGTVLTWAGMRGVVTLAAAQSLPADTAARATLVLVAFATAMVTLLVQGGTLPWIVRRLGLSRQGAEIDPEELRALLDRLAGTAREVCTDSELTRSDGGTYPTSVLEEVLRDSSFGRLNGRDCSSIFARQDSGAGGAGRGDDRSGNAPEPSAGSSGQDDPAGRPAEAEGRASEAPDDSADLDELPDTDRVFRGPEDEDGEDGLEVAAGSATESDAAEPDLFAQYHELRIVVVQTQRDALLEIRREGVHSSPVLSRALRTLDAEQIELELHVV